MQKNGPVTVKVYSYNVRKLLSCAVRVGRRIIYHSGMTCGLVEINENTYR